MTSLGTSILIALGRLLTKGVLPQLKEYPQLSPIIAPMEAVFRIPGVNWLILFFPT